MKLIKSFGYSVTSIALHVSVLFIICAFCFNVLVEDRQSIKNVLIDSGVYPVFVDSVIQDNESSQTGSSLPLHDQDIYPIIQKAFPKEDLQASSELFIDGIYDWMDGTSKDLRFTIDFSANKEQMFREISLYASNRISSLPTCGSEHIQEKDIFSIECRPLGYFPKDAQEQVYGDLSAGEFLSDPVITEVNLPQTEDGSTIENKFNVVPTIYGFMKNSIPVSILMFVLSFVSYIAVRRPINKGFKAIGRDLLLNGLSLIGFTLVIGFLLPRYFNDFQIENGSITSLANRISDSFIRELDVVVINVSLQIAALGLLILVLRFMSLSGSDRYSSVESKSGLTTGVARSTATKPKKKPKKAPLQSSENSNLKKISKQKSKRYRKIKP